MPDSLRDESAIKHMYEYCVEIERTLSEISYDREKYDQNQKSGEKSGDEQALKRWSR